MSANFAAILYTVSAVLFILALRGLSSPAVCGHSSGHWRGYRGGDRP